MTETRMRPAAWRAGTLAVHAGFEPDAETGSVAPPIYQTSTFSQDGVGRPRGGWEYARTGNPTRARLERAIAELEGAGHGFAYGSGSAATATVGQLVLPGEEVLIADDVYGGTFRFFERVLAPTGVVTRYLDLSADPLSAVDGACTSRTRMVWIETPSNPLLKLVDIAAVARALGSRRGADGERPLLVVDNTFATPLSQRPIELGADVVVHSATKYLAGHSDVVSGAAVTSRDDLAERLGFLQNAIGAVPGPLDCFLVLRGMRTLELRVERHASNALRVATAIAERPDVAAVRYPGLADGPHAHPQAALAASQMRYAGGMISFVPAARSGRTAEERARRFAERTELFALAESLGGVESLVELPAAMTHAAVSGSALEVPAALVRLSVGIEDPADLVEDVVRALDQA